MRKLPIGVVVTFGCLIGGCAPVDEPATGAVEQAATTAAIARGSTWRYWDRGGDLGSAWAAPAYDASSWASGAGPLGYGESYLATTVGYGANPAAKYITTYFRREFTVTDPARVTRLLGEVMYDDGIVVWLNGTRIGSDSMPAGTTTASTRALGHEAAQTYQAYDWSAQRPLLVAGTNTIAVEVHQLDAGSSDLVFDLALALEESAAPPPPPAGEDIARGATWSYWDRGGDLGTAWRAPAYDASGWARGAGPLGYGESYLATTVGYGANPAAKYITTYFRNHVTVADPAAVTAIAGAVMYDDGAVVYLNGHELARLAMPAGTITAATLAPGHETGNTYETFDWTAARTFLVAGDNVIAVEVHQSAASSSDLTFDLALDISTGTSPPPPPAVEGIARQSSWRVMARADQQPDRWMFDGYDDSAWPTFAAPTGYGEPYLRSTITYGPDPAHKWTTTYFRHDFFVEDASAVEHLVAEVMYDDGVRIWLNGRPLLTRGLPAAGVTWSTFAASHEAGNAYETIDLDAQRSWLHPGLNTIAVEVHQDDAASSDLVFDLALRVTSGPQPSSIARRSAWTYWDQPGDPAAGWTTASSTSGWNAGYGELGFGSFHSTDLERDGVAYYFRRRFHVADPAAVTELRGELLYEDGAAIYVNGHELPRVNLPAGPLTPTTLASSDHHPDGSPGQGRYEAFDWSAARDYLVAGDNTIAVEVHLSATDAEDLAFDLALTVVTAATPRIAGCTPATPNQRGDNFPWSGLTHVWIAPGGTVWATGTDGILGRRSAGGSWAWCTLGPDDRWGGVWGTADDDVWIAGSAGLVRWDGAGFTPVEVGTSAELTGLWGSGADDVFVIGEGGVVRHFDGDTWQVLDLPAGHTTQGVWGASASDVWLTGHSSHPYEPMPDYGVGVNEIYRWDAAAGAFALEATFEEAHGGNSLANLGGSGPTDVWIVGESTQAGAADTQPFAAHYDGSAWTRVFPPDSLFYTGSELTGVASRAPGAETGAWVLVERQPALRFDGTSWSRGPDVTDSMRDVEVRGAAMFAVGKGFHVARWDGTTWVRDF